MVGTALSLLFCSEFFSLYLVKLIDFVDWITFLLPLVFLAGVISNRPVYPPIRFNTFYDQCETRVTPCKCGSRKLRVPSSFFLRQNFKLILFPFFTKTMSRLMEAFSLLGDTEH